MGLGTAAIIAGSTLAGGAIGKALGARKARKLEEELAGTAAGQAREAETKKAAGRQISGDYGMSEAERRKITGQIEEASRGQIAQAQRGLLTEVARSGMLGRSGSTSTSLAGLDRAVAEAGAKAGGQAAQASQQVAAAQKAQDAGTLDTAYLGEVAGQDKREELKAILQKRGAQFGESLARSGLIGAGDTSSAAGPAVDAAAERVG